MASSTPKGMVLRSQKSTSQASSSNLGLRPIIKTPFRPGSKPPSHTAATVTSLPADSRDKVKVDRVSTTSSSDQSPGKDRNIPTFKPGLYMVPKERLKTFLSFDEVIGTGGSMSASTSEFHGFQSRDLVRPRTLAESEEKAAKGARTKSPTMSPVIDLTQFSPSPERAKPKSKAPPATTALPTPTGIDRRPSVPCEYHERLRLAGQLLTAAEARHESISEQLRHLSMVLNDIHRQQFEWQRHLELVRECIKYEGDDPFYD